MNGMFIKCDNCGKEDRIKWGQKTNWINLIVSDDTEQHLDFCSEFCYMSYYNKLTKLWIEKLSEKLFLEQQKPAQIDKTNDADQCFWCGKASPAGCFCSDECKVKYEVFMGDRER